jgi:hypothetical protein
MPLFAIIPVAVLVPAVIVLDLAALTFPIAVVVSVSIVAWRHPTCRWISRATPISFMPRVTAIHWIPIAVHPDIIRTRGYRANTNHAGRGRRANPDSETYFSRECYTYR